VRHLLVLGLASLAASVAPALTAHAPRPAGGAVGRVSGYRVADVSFGLDEVAADRVRRVSFDLVPPTARTVRVAVGTSTTACRVRAGRAVCVFTGTVPALRDLASLTVLAAS
jgi:hypothetical protein